MVSSTGAVKILGREGFAWRTVEEPGVAKGKRGDGCGCITVSVQMVAGSPPSHP